MNSWKFLLYGITGDLSKKKILPAIAQFAELQQGNLSIDLIGYSRSEANKEEIFNLLNNNSSDNKHFLNSVEFSQGEYNDAQFIIKLLNSLKNNERLVVYVATPPIVFLQLLEVFCPHYEASLDILIEKPFGESLEEANKLLNKIKECKLENKVHFIDHYLFKTSSIISEIIMPDLEILKQKQLKKISVQALENIGVKNRGGYYDSNGALKDFFPTHLVSIFDLGIKLLSYDLSYSETFNVQNLELGQYENYLSDLELESSQTESYFKVEGSLKIDKSLINIDFESGKSLKEKKTEIHLEFVDGTNLYWNIDPRKILELQLNSMKFQYNLEIEKKFDHTNMFEAVLNKDFSRFLTEEEIIKGWKMYEKVLEFKANNNIQTKVYKEGVYPIEFINENGV